jgi:hypothetical protein
VDDEPALRGCLMFVCGVMFIVAGQGAMRLHRFGLKRVTIATGPAAFWIGVVELVVGVLILYSVIHPYLFHVKHKGP